MIKYHGEFAELQSLVSELGYSGTWFDRGGVKVFRSSDGAVLNWWPPPSAGTIQIQGQEDSKTKLENDVSAVLLNGVRTSEISTDPSEDDTSSTTDMTSPSASVDSSRVFVVHGHDDVARVQLHLVLNVLNLEPFVLANTSGGGLTIIEALANEIFSQATGKRFGIVLLTPDDMGYEQGSNPEAAEPRARQNVVMEMGMLIAAFGRERVAILRKGDVIVPSDASGILYIPFSTHVRETVPKLCERLREAGFELSTDAVLKALAL